MKQLMLSFLILVAMAGQSFAQIEAPQPSPLSTLIQKVGLTEVKVEYSRPGKKNRKIFGDLVSFGQYWRTGANGATLITFSDDVKIAGNPLPKGKYALYTIPDLNEWTIIFHKNTSHWGFDEADYKQEEDALRLKIKPSNITESVETFTIDVCNIRNSEASIDLVWETTRVSIPFLVDTDTKVMADIKTKMEGPSAASYYQAARYYYDENKDAQQAYTWIKNAIDKGGEKFWYVRLRALIEARLGDIPSAIASAEKSKELAEKEGNQDYVKMNVKSISEWKGGKK